MSVDEKRVREILVYLGRRHVHPHDHDTEKRTKTLHMYHVVHASTSPPSLGAVRGYSREVGRGTPGSMQSFEFSGENSETVYPGTRQHEGVWHDDAARAKWQAEEDATLRAVEAARAELRESDERLDLELLRPFREAYAELSGPARVQLIARIASYVSGMTESRMRLARKKIDESAKKPPKKSGSKK